VIYEENLMKQVLPKKILLGLLDGNFTFSDPPSLYVGSRPRSKFGSTLFAECAVFTALRLRRANEYRADGFDFFINME
jgi:hypothetical protein